MADMMTFPNTVEEFMEQYKITDTEQIYTNGAELVPIFRMKQWFTHKPEQHWIPCSERLPEEDNWAIWCSNEGSIQVARWKIDAMDHFFPDQGFFEMEDAVAWMPLPEPYKERRE